MKFSSLVRAFLLIVALCGFLFFAVANFSVKESRYECVGKYKYNDEEFPKTLYIKIQEFRWWVGLWSNDAGYMFIEEPTLRWEFHTINKKREDQLRIEDWDGSIIARFSTLSKTLEIKWNGGDFAGKGTLISK